MEPANPGRQPRRMKRLERISLPSSLAPDMGRDPDALEQLRNVAASVHDVGPLCLRIVVGQSSITVGIPTDHDATDCPRCRRWRAQPNPLRDRISERFGDHLRDWSQLPQDEAPGPC
jgi:hypothetical protein